MGPRDFKKEIRDFRKEIADRERMLSRMDLSRLDSTKMHCSVAPLLSGPYGEKLH
jgi:hypothetical protein